MKHRADEGWQHNLGVTEHFHLEHFLLFVLQISMWNAVADLSYYKEQ